MLANAVSFTAASLGSGTYVFGLARPSFRTPAQAVSDGSLVDGNLYSYLAQDSLSAPTQREWGMATFSAAGNSFARTSIIGGVSLGTDTGSSPVNFLVAPIVSLTALKEDFTRFKLTGNTNYYVTIAGNNSTGNGSIGNPWATLQFALNFLSQNVDIAGFQVIVNIGAGTFAGADLPSFFGGGIVQVYGAGSSSTTLNDAPSGQGTINSQLAQTSSFGIDRVTLTPLIAQEPCINHYGLAFFYCGDVQANNNHDIVFNPGHHAWCAVTGSFGAAIFIGAPGGGLNVSGTFTITQNGGAPFGFALAEFGAAVICTGTFVFSGVTSWASSGVRLTSGGQFINNDIVSMTGTVNSGALRFLCEFGSNFSDNFSGLHLIPGDIEGSTDGTSTYGEAQYLRLFGPLVDSDFTLFSGLGWWIIEMQSASPHTFTIPLQATIGDGAYLWPVTNGGGVTKIRVVQVGTGTVTIQAATGVTLNGVLAGSFVMSGQWSAVTLYTRALDSWAAVTGI